MVNQNPEQPLSPEIPKPAVEVWVLNDHQIAHDTFKNILSSTSYGSDMIINPKYLFTTEQVLLELEVSVIEGNPLPDIIFVDYDLKEGLDENIQTDFPTGIQSIQAITFYCQQNQIKVPFFLATSTNKDKNRELINAGANATYDDSLPIRQRTEQLRQLLKSLSEQK